MPIIVGPGMDPILVTTVTSGTNGDKKDVVLVTIPEAQIEEKK